MPGNSPNSEYISFKLLTTFQKIEKCGLIFRPIGEGFSHSDLDDGRIPVKVPAAGKGEMSHLSSRGGISNHNPAFHDKAHLLKPADVFKGVPRHGDEIGQLSGGQ